MINDNKYVLYLRAFLMLFKELGVYLILILSIAVALLMYLMFSLIPLDFSNVKDFEWFDYFGISCVGMLSLILIILVVFAVKIALYDDVKNNLSDLRYKIRDRKRNEILKYFNNFFARYINENMEFKHGARKIYVSSEIYHLTYVRTMLYYEFVLDENRNGKDIGFHPKGVIIDKVKPFFEYE